ncbi:hypothetical protein FACS1894205_2530 [Alphaproteobacteria bacterium]|nr:hypothetical protein FACS1894205_2530 [Alphaproteobacteria bacterium]
MHNNSAIAGFNKHMITLGIATLFFALLANFIPAVYLFFFHGIIPPFEDIMLIWGVAAATYGVSWVIQPIAYYGVLGASSSYICWVAGSVGDIRLPAAAMAQKIAGVESGTHEGDLMAIMGVASSVFVSVAIVTLFTFVGANVLPYLPQFIHKAFQYILPALFAAVYMEVGRKDIRAGVGGIAVGMLLTYLGITLKAPGWAMTVIIVASGIAVNRVLWIYDQSKKKSA